MARNYSKATYTIGEIAEIVHGKCPGRYKNEKIAGREVCRIMKELGIDDINGKKRFKQIAATDAVKIIRYMLDEMNRKQKRRAQQVSLFDDGIVDWLDPYTEDIQEGPEIVETERAASVEEIDPRDLFEAITELLNALHRVAELIGYKGRM